MKQAFKYKKSDIAELTQPGGRDFSISSALLDCDNDVIKGLVNLGAKIEYSKRVRLELRGFSDSEGVSKRDLIYMSIPLSVLKPTVPGVKFGYVIYTHASAKDTSRIRTVVNFASVDIDTNRFMIFGSDFECSANMNEKWKIEKADVKKTLDSIEGYFKKLDRFLVSLENDIPKKDQVKILNRELIGVMLRTARRTTEVINIDAFNKEEALKITLKLERCSWSKKRTKLQLWRIAFNNVFDIDYVNSLEIEYRLNQGISTMFRKYKGEESISSHYEIPIIELISRSLLSTLVTPGNFEDLMIPVKFDISNFL